MKNTTKRVLTISLLSISLSAGIALVPVLSNIALVFPDQKELVQLLITLPSLFMMFSSLLTDKFAKITSIKFITTTSILLILFAGISPYWINSFTYLLFTRGLMGIGLGLLNTTISSLPALYFDESNTRDHAVGIQSAFVCVGGILFNLLSGVFAKYNWKYVFLVQLLNIIPLFVAIFLMPKTERHILSKSNNPNPFVKGAVPVTVISFIIIILTCTYPLNLSLFVEKQGLGDSQFVGVLSSINSAIGFFIGLFFGKVYAKMKEQTLSLGLALAAAALLIVTFASSQTILLWGSIGFGIGTSFILPSLYSMLYTRVQPEEVVSSAAMLGIACNVSQFISPFIINSIAGFVDINNAEGTRFIIASILIILLVIFLYLARRRKVAM